MRMRDPCRPHVTRSSRRSLAGGGASGRGGVRVVSDGPVSNCRRLAAQLNRKSGENPAELSSIASWNGSLDLKTAFSQECFRGIISPTSHVMFVI